VTIPTLQMFLKSQGIRLPDGFQLTIQHLVSLERPAHPKTSLPTWCKNQPLNFFHTAGSKPNILVLVSISVLRKGIHDAESIATAQAAADTFLSRLNLDFHAF